MSLFVIFLAAAAVAPTQTNTESSFDDIALYCEVKPVKNLTPMEVDAAATPRKLQVWYGRFPVPDVETDEYGTLAFVVDPSDLFPDEYSWRNELPDSFRLIARDEWLRIIRFSKSGSSDGEAMDVMIASVQQRGTGSQFRVKDVLRGTCTRTRDSFEDFYRKVHR